MGLIVDGPDINQSRWRYYGHGRFVVAGFMAIKGLSRSGADMIIGERERRGEYKSLEDFIRRVNLGRGDIIALCPAGAFDNIAGGLSRTIQARRLLAANTGNAQKGQRDLFAVEAGSPYPVMTKPLLAPPLTRIQKTDRDLWEEYRTLGFLRNVHPLALWKNEVSAVKGRIKARYIGDYIGRYVKMIGWPIAQKDVWTKDGLTMSFLSLEDETALYETVIFPQVYEKYNRLLFDQRPLLVYGRVCDDMGAVSFEVQRIEPLGVTSPAAQGKADAFRYSREMN
jgi:DNA polymerase-3 subunit alpha/error-prone DNA polymerase